MMQKRFVLMMLATVFVTTFLSAMDRPVPTKEVHCCSVHTCGKATCDHIDAELLGVKKDAWFKSIRGTWASALEYAGCNGDESQIKRRLFEIDSTIPEHCRNGNTFTALQKNHWYVSYIMTDMIGRRAEQFKKVTGSQVNKLLAENPIIDNDLSLQMNRWIHFQAKDKYIQDMGYLQDLTKIPFGTADEDIHYTKLHGQGISSIQKIHVHVTGNDNDYILGVTERGEQCFWSVQNGDKCNNAILSDDDVRTCLMDEWVNTGSHLIVVGVVRSAGIDNIMRTLYSQQGYTGIVLFAKPTFESYVCQQALKNSKSDKKGLKKLQNFVRITALLKGFVKNNLLNMIFARLLKFDGEVKEVY